MMPEAGSALSDMAPPCAAAAAVAPWLCCSSRAGVAVDVQGAGLEPDYDIGVTSVTGPLSHTCGAGRGVRGGSGQGAEGGYSSARRTGRLRLRNGMVAHRPCRPPIHTRRAAAAAAPSFVSGKTLSAVGLKLKCFVLRRQCVTMSAQHTQCSAAWSRTRCHLLPMCVQEKHLYMHVCACVRES